MSVEKWVVVSLSDFDSSVESSGMVDGSSSCDSSDLVVTVCMELES